MLTIDFYNIYNSFLYVKCTRKIILMLLKLEGFKNNVYEIAWDILVDGEFSTP